MLNNKMIKEMIKNGGATLDYNYNNFNVSVGYMVSIKGNEKKININDIENIKKEISKKMEFVKNKKGYYIGLWVENGLMYVDISKHIIKYDRALEVARNNKQLAVYDLKNDKSIYLNYKTYYTLYKVIKNKDNDIIDYKIVKQFDKKEDIKKEINASIKTIDNIIYKSFKQYEKRGKDYQGLILVSDKISVQELELYNSYKKMALVKSAFFWYFLNAPL